MKHRIILIPLVVAAIALFAMPSTAASASSPWWQVLTGTRPTNLWVATDQKVEITSKKDEGSGLLAGRIEVDGEVIGCLGAGSFFGLFSADEVCQFFGAPEATETAEELKSLLEVPFATSDLEVTGGPAGDAPFQITVFGRSTPPPVVSPLESLPAGSARVTTLAEGGSGTIVLSLTNLGDAAVDGTTNPVNIVDELPEGVEATAAKGFAGPLDNAGPVDCAVEADDLVSCNFEGVLAPYDAIEIEVRTSLIGNPPAAGNPGAVTVSGGNAPTATATQNIRVSPEKAPFGFELFSSLAEEEGGAPTVHAGRHPFQLSTTIQFNSGLPQPGATRREVVLEQPGLPRNLRFPLPTGLVGTAKGLPQCSMKVFFEVSASFVNKCPSESAIGVASTTVIEHKFSGLLRLAVPLFNLPPGLGEPARFGLVVVGVPVVIDTAVDPNDKYRIIAKVNNAPQEAQLLSSTVVIWGTPGDPRHDNSRGWNCVYTHEKLGPCVRPSNLGEAAFLRQPVSCVTPFDFSAEAEPWNTPVGSVIAKAESPGEEMEACNQVPFDPTVSASPTNRSANGSSGLNFQLDMPNAGLFNKDAIAEGQAKKVEVTLPEGVSINPSQAEGLGACNPSQYGQERFDSGPGEGCPESSKIGTVDITTPLLEEEAHGAVYVAEPYDNPFDSLLALYMVAKIPERGVLVKQAGQVKLNPDTGQIVTTFDDLPQIPFESFKLRFFGGDPAPLVMPDACGSYDIVAKFTPWNAADPDNPLPSEVATRKSSFKVEEGPGGGPCTSGMGPFKPRFVAGTESSAAGHYSPLSARLTREDGEQELTRFSMKLPKGVIGKLAGVPFCPDAAIAAARARTGPHGGQEELDSPSCPTASQIGRTLVGAGVGSALTYAPGRIYLAGPYDGARLSIAAITTAKVGPFDLGTVVIRQALRIDPATAEVTTDGSSSDPIPRILQGVVVHARDIRIFVDRKDFILNPTSCEKMNVRAAVSGLGSPVDVSSPFQAAECASLGFKPRVQIRLTGKRSTRGANPALLAVLRPRAGNANPEQIAVTLPGSELLEQSHIRTICTRVQYAAGGGFGGGCPAGSVYGHVKAWTPLLDKPLKGPVYLRSSNHELPDMVLALHGLVDIESVGRIDSTKGRIRTTFENVPDAPLTKVVLDMQGGRKGLLVNSTDICRGVHRAKAKFIGQNGKVHRAAPEVSANCKGGGPKGKRR